MFLVLSQVWAFRFCWLLLLFCLYLSTWMYALFTFSFAWSIYWNTRKYFCLKHPLFNSQKIIHLKVHVNECNSCVQQQIWYHWHNDNNSNNNNNNNYYYYHYYYYLPIYIARIYMCWSIALYNHMFKRKWKYISVQQVSQVWFFYKYTYQKYQFFRNRSKGF